MADSCGVPTWPRSGPSLRVQKKERTRKRDMDSDEKKCTEHMKNTKDKSEMQRENKDHVRAWHSERDRRREGDSERTNTQCFGYPPVHHGGPAFFSFYSTRVQCFVGARRSAPQGSLSPHPSQVMRPSSLLNTWIYVSNPCSSTDLVWRRLMIQLRASRHRLRTRTWTMSKFVLCWLHHCTYRSEKQVQNDHKFITLYEKTWCPVHLKIR